MRLFQIIAIICDAMCVGTLLSNRTGFYNPIMHCGRLELPASSVLPGGEADGLFTFVSKCHMRSETTELNAIGSRLFATQFFGLCEHEQNHNYFRSENAPILWF